MRENVRDRDRLEHIVEAITNILDFADGKTKEQLDADTDWDEWEKNEVVIVESAVHKNIVQTARRMKKDGMAARQISRYTGLTAEEIEEL